MARFNAMTEKYDEVTILGKPALFTSLRIDGNTLPKGIYLYEIRHADENWGRPCEIAKGILVNHMGTVLTRVPILLPNDGYLNLEAKDLNFISGGCQTVKEFMEKYPPFREKKKDGPER